MFPRVCDIFRLKLVSKPTVVVSKNRSRLSETSALHIFGKNANRLLELLPAAGHFKRKVNINATSNQMIGAVARLPVTKLTNLRYVVTFAVGVPHKLASGPNQKIDMVRRRTRFFNCARTTQTQWNSTHYSTIEFMLGSSSFAIRHRHRLKTDISVDQSTRCRFCSLLHASLLCALCRDYPQGGQSDQEYLRLFRMIVSFPSHIGSISSCSILVLLCSGRGEGPPLR